MTTSFLSSQKLLTHPKRFKDWFETGDTQAPIMVKMDLTNTCNHACPDCYDQELIATSNDRLHVDRISKLFDEFRELDVKSVQFVGGGEPTLHPEFTKITQAAAERGLAIGLITNGSHFHRLPMSDLLPLFSWIRVSLDAYDQTSYTRSHGKPAHFDRTISNIRALIGKKQAEKLDVTIGVGYLTNNKLDTDALNAFFSLSRHLEVDYAQIRPVYGSNLIVSTKQLDWPRSLRKIAQEYETDQFRVVINDTKYQQLGTHIPKRAYNRCHAQGVSGTTITAKGDVYVCCSLMSDMGLIGNINQTQFQDIWRSEKRMSVVENLNIHQCPPLCAGDGMNTFLNSIKHMDVANHPLFV